MSLGVSVATFLAGFAYGAWSRRKADERAAASAAQVAAAPAPPPPAPPPPPKLMVPRYIRGFGFLAEPGDLVAGSDAITTSVVPLDQVSMLLVMAMVGNPNARA